MDDLIEKVATRKSTRPVLVTTRRTSRRATAVDVKERKPRVKQPKIKVSMKGLLKKSRKSSKKLGDTKPLKEILPTFPYPPIAHAHQVFEIPSPEFELVTDPIVEEPILPEIDFSIPFLNPETMFPVQHDKKVNSRRKHCISFALRV